MSPSKSAKKRKYRSDAEKLALLREADGLSGSALTAWMDERGLNSGWFYRLRLDPPKLDEVNAVSFSGSDDKTRSNLAREYSTLAHGQKRNWLVKHDASGSQLMYHLKHKMGRASPNGTTAVAIPITAGEQGDKRDISLREALQAFQVKHDIMGELLADMQRFLATGSILRQ